MRLSDIQNEQALDVFADIIVPASVILEDSEVKDAFRTESKPVAISKMIKNHKKEVLEILARLDGEAPENYKCNMYTLPRKLFEILSDPNFSELFTFQAQKNG